MKLHISFIPEDIINRYNLKELVVDGFVYIRIQKGIYGLKQAAILTNQQLQTNIAKEGITLFPEPPACGNIEHGEQRSYCVLMTSE